MTFGLERVQAVTFRCGECRTIVSFPRLRWANFSNHCPNCGVRWMERPGPGDGREEDPATTAYRAIRSFREGLQALIGLEKTAGFAVGLELDDVLQESSGESVESDAVKKLYQ